MQEMARYQTQTLAWYVDILRRFCWRNPDRSDPWCFRAVPGDLVRINDPPRLGIEGPIAVPLVLVPEMKDVSQPGPGIRLPLSSQYTVIGGLKEGQQWHRWTAPVEKLMGG